MNIGDLWFGARLDGTPLQLDAKKAGEAAGVVAGQSFGARMKQAVGGAIPAGLGIAAGMKAFNLLGGAADRAVTILENSVRKAQENEVAYTKLTASLRANVAGWDGDIEAIKRANEAGAKLGFTDDEMADSLAKLVAATHDVAEAETIRATAMDLARFKGIDLGEATDALTKVEAGSYKMLKNLGIELKAGATQTEALAAVQKVAAGQAVAFGSTTAGAMKKFNATLDQAEEKLGNALIGPLTTVANVLADEVIPRVEKFADDAAGAAKPVLDLADALGKLNAKAKEGGVDLGSFWAAANPQDNILEKWQNVWDLVNGLTDAEYRFFHQTADGAAYAGSSMETLAGKMADDLIPAAVAAVAPLDALNQAIYYSGVRAIRAAKPLRDYFAIFDAVVGKGNIAQTTLNILDDNKAIREAQQAVENATPGTWQYKRAQLELAVAQGQLAGDTETLRTQQSELFLLKPDKANQAALAKFYHDIGLGVNDLTGKAKEAYDALWLLNHMDVTGPKDVTKSVNRPTARASGGPTIGGRTYWVGERGPELWVEQAPGQMLDHQDAVAAVSGSGAAGGPTINITNPVPHAAEEDIARTLRRLSRLGM